MTTMSPEQPVAWNTYVAVADADATMAKAEAAGAHTLMAPMDVTDVGRMAMFADPTGACWACGSRARCAGPAWSTSPAH